MKFASSIIAAGVIALGTLACAGQALAQDTSSRPVRIIVGAPPGGTTDNLARAVAKGMEGTLKRPVIVENKPGAGGNLAADYVAKSEPNGETILMSFTSHTVNPSLYKKLPFDAVKDFTPITMIATVPSILIASPAVPVNSVSELISYAKAHPGKLTFALGAIGSSVHLAGEQFKMMTGTEIMNVPYKGTAPALTDLIGGHVDLMFASTINVLPHAHSGKIKILGTTSATPMAQFPKVPPIGATVKGFESNAWFGLFGPAKLPAETTQQLYEAAKKAIDDPAFQKRLEDEGGRPASMTPTQFSAFVVQDIQRWARIVKFSGATVE